jgi:hypothetical protein
VNGLENTITEHDIDPTSRELLQALRSESGDLEPDLSVDGLSESILSKLFQLFTPRKS